MAARVELPQLVSPLSRRHLDVHDNNRSNNATDDVHNDQLDDDEEEDEEAAKWEGRANLFVAVRLRPRVALDRLALTDVVRVANARQVIVRSSPLPTTTRKPTALLPLVQHSAPVLERTFVYDRVFSAKDGQATVYSQTARALIPGVLRGCNATVLAYGCTGAGKTFTMLGSPEDPGLMARALDDLFRRINIKIQASSTSSPTTISFRVVVSFLEVYNETIRDLLTPATASSSVGLDLREDPARGVASVAGLSEVEVRSAREVLALLRKGHRRRAQEATAANGASSRSHALLQVLVEQRATTETEWPQSEPQTSSRATTTVVTIGKLSLVDLAGSERAAATQNRGLRLVEGANINRSLLALGNCINALADRTGGPTGGFVPYRDSKLTRLLKDALGGNCRTVLIANVSPSAGSAEETLRTLQYAARARNIQTTVASNVVVSSTGGGEAGGDADEGSRRSPRGRQGQHEAGQEGVISGLRGEIDALRRALDDQQRSVGPTQSPVALKSPTRVVQAVERVPASPERRGNNEDEDNSEVGEPHVHGEGEGRGVEGEQRPSMDDQVLAARRVIAEAFAAQRQCARELKAAEDELAAAVHAARSALPTETGDGEVRQSALPGTSQDTETTVVPSPTRRVLALKHMQTQALARLAASDSRLRELRRRVDALPAPSGPTSPLPAPSWSPPRVPMSQSLVRELLLLEFRVGELEGDKLALELQCGRADAGRAIYRISSDDDAWLGALEARFPVEDASTAGPTEVSTELEAADDLVVGRLVGQGGQAEEGAPVSPTATARRQWGIQVRNPSLPYIRRRKRPPAALPALPSELPALLPVVSGRAVGGSGSGALPSTSLPVIGPGRAGGGALAAFTSPYLKVLKQRQQRHPRHK